MLKSHDAALKKKRREMAKRKNFLEGTNNCTHKKPSGNQTIKHRRVSITLIQKITQN
jgi:hypothetical protein